MDRYERFQLQWMIDHGYSLSDLMRELQALQYDDPEDSDRISTPITELFEEWEQDVGFGSEIWPCEAEWEECEGKQETTERRLDALWTLAKLEDEGIQLTEDQKRQYVWLVETLHKEGTDIPFGIEI